MRVVGGVVPGKFIPAVERGVADTLDHGVIAGYRVIDVKVTLFDGSYHDVDSDDMSFRLPDHRHLKKDLRKRNRFCLNQSTR